MLLDVVLCSLDVEAGGDLLVREPEVNEACDLAFAQGEADRPRVVDRGCELGDAPPEGGGDAGIARELISDHRRQHVDQLGDSGLAVDVPRRARLGALEDRVLVAAHADHGHRGGRRCPTQHRDRPEALGDGEVEHGDVGRRVRYRAQRRPQIGPLAHHGHAGVAKRSGDALAIEPDWSDHDGAELRRAAGTCGPSALDWAGDGGDVRFRAGLISPRRSQSRLGSLHARPFACQAETLLVAHSASLFRFVRDSLAVPLGP
jgi:hypothetical protein